MRGLILDFGGVLTSDYWACLRSFARREGLDEERVVGLIKGDTFAALERGELTQHEARPELAGRLGVPAPGLFARMAADLRRDEEMLDAVASLRASGVRIGILSNSWGAGPFDLYGGWDLHRIADDVVLSHVVGRRKPEPDIYRLATARLGVPPSECAFIDDVAINLPPAKALGIRAIHHTATAGTLAALSRLGPCRDEP